MSQRKEARLYKYLEEKYAVKMLEEGNLKIGNLYEYRTHWNDQIRDEEEAKYTAEHRVPPGEEKLTGLAAEMIVVEDGVTLHHDGIIASAPRELPNRNIYCTTETASKAVMEQFDSDACIEIVDVYNFFLAVRKALAHQGISDGELRVKKCSYEGNIVDYYQQYDGLYALGYWMKRPFYEPQQEVRAVFNFNTSNQVVKTEYVNVPEIIPFIRRHTF